MNEPVQEPLIQNTDSPALIPSLWQRIVFGLFVVAAPIFNFTFINVMKPDWQSGKLSDYINLFLLPEASLLFFPLLVYSIACYLLLLWDKDRFAKLFFIRFGVYTGAFLALQYSLLTIPAFEISPYSILLVLGYFSPLIIKKLYLWLIAKWNAARVQSVILAVGIAAMLIFMVLWRSVFSPFVLAVFLIGILAPFWSFLIAGQAALWLIKNYENKFTFMRGFGLTAWLASYSYALRFNVLKMYELYAALPPQPPDCYIATAAAKGHPNFVRSRLILLSNGKEMRVNSQLKHFKFAELTLQATVPRFHKLLRRLYDVIGKALSHNIQHPLLADITYLLLKPFEWISIKILSLLVPDAERMASKIYDDHQNKPGVFNAH